MKKLLLSTSAIALAGAIATPASAAEWEVRLGGYMEQHIGYASIDDDAAGSSDGLDGVDTSSDSEVYFLPSITLDNGLKFGAVTQLEGRSSTSTDEVFAYITGSFGSLQIGDDDNAANTMGYSAPDVSMVGINSGSDTDWLAFGALGGTTTTFVHAGTFDDAGIRYFTPRLAGFALGVSYARDGNQSDSDGQVDTDADGVLHDIFGIGANYVNTFGDVSIALSGGYVAGSRNGVSAASGFFVDGTDSGEDAGLHSYDCTDTLGSTDVVVKECTAQASGKNPEAWSAGLVFGFGGISVGGSYADFNSAVNGGMEVYDLGVSYSTGPWGFSITYLHAEIDSNDEVDKFMLATTYSVATGVKVGAFGTYQDLDAGGSGDDIDGFIIGTSVRLDY